VDITFSQAYKVLLLTTKLYIMTQYTEVKNKETGATEFNFNGTLTEIGKQTLKNVNDKEYKIMTVQFYLPNSKEVERSALCYASNYENGMEVGKSYLCNLSFDGNDKPNIRISHLTNAERATSSDFEGLFQVERQVVKSEADIS